MSKYVIEIKWEGPLSVNNVIKKKNDAGNSHNNYAGNDYGLYQIYGKHILCGLDTLLYVGKASRQTFSARFKQHKKEWLKDEAKVKIYLGRAHDPKKHSNIDNWRIWENDIEDAERILIYKYAPNYNSSEIGDKPKLHHKQIKLIHKGKKHRLKKIDNAPGDYLIVKK